MSIKFDDACKTTENSVNIETLMNEYHKINVDIANEIINRCINEGVFKDFIVSNRQEVKDVLTEELVAKEVLDVVNDAKD